MAALAKQTLSAGDIKELPKAHVESVAHETFKVSKLTVQPGWKWSECIKPLVGTDSCQVAHSGVVTEGSMTVKMDDGTEMTFEAGDTFYIPPRTRRVGERRCPHGRIRGERTEQGQRRSKRREFSLGGPGLTPSPTSHPAQHSLHPSRGREPAHGRPRRSRARAGRFPRRGPASKKKLKKKEYAAVASVLRWVSRTTSPPPPLSSLIKRGQPQRLNLLAPLKVPQRVALEPERAMETRRARVL